MCNTHNIQIHCGKPAYHNVHVPFFKLERVEAEYRNIVDELLTQRNKAKEEIENFVEYEAAAKHAEIVRQLRINDAKYIDYHQVQQPIIPDWSYRAFPLYMNANIFKNLINTHFQI